MRRYSLVRGFCYFVSTLSMCGLFGSAIADGPQAPPPQRARDFSKTMVIEKPVKDLVRSTAKAAVDGTPAGTAAETTVSGEAGGATNRAASRTVGLGADRQTVTPGLVRWHRTLADACQAAAQSGKPLLVFHLMGSLDERFT
jgi:hypothetical protein